MKIYFFILVGLMFNFKPVFSFECTKYLKSNETQLLNNYERLNNRNNPGYEWTIASWRTEMLSFDPKMHVSKEDNDLIQSDAIFPQGSIDIFHKPIVTQNSSYTVNFIRDYFDLSPWQLSEHNALCGPISLVNGLIHLKRLNYSDAMQMVFAKLKIVFKRNYVDLMQHKGMTVEQFFRFLQSFEEFKTTVQLFSAGEASVNLRQSITHEDLVQLDGVNALGIAVIKRDSLTAIAPFETMFRDYLNSSNSVPTNAMIWELEQLLFETRFSPRANRGHYVLLKSVQKVDDTFYRFEIIDPEEDEKFGLVSYYLYGSIEKSRYGVDLIRIYDPRYLPDIGEFLHSRELWPSFEKVVTKKYQFNGFGTAFTSLMIVPIEK